MKKMLLMCYVATATIFSIVADTRYEYAKGITWSYRINGDTAEILPFDGPGPRGAVAIPSSLGGYPVTSIGDRVFSWNRSITSITIPNGVTIIGDEAFSWCEDLRSVIIPGSVMSIGDHAFLSCYKLTLVKISDGVMSIGDGAFSGCRSLVGLTIPNSVAGIGDNAFSDCCRLRGLILPKRFDGQSWRLGLSSAVISYREEHELKIKYRNESSEKQLPVISTPYLF